MFNVEIAHVFLKDPRGYYCYDMFEPYDELRFGDGIEFMFDNFDDCLKLLEEAKLAIKFKESIISEFAERKMRYKISARLVYLGEYEQKHCFAIEFDILANIIWDY